LRRKTDFSTTTIASFFFRVHLFASVLRQRLLRLSVSASVYFVFLCVYWFVIVLSFSVSINFFSFSRSLLTPTNHVIQFTEFFLSIEAWHVL
jgi:hypothetical protein